MKKKMMMLVAGVVVLAFGSVSRAEIFYFYEDAIIQDGDTYPWPDTIHVYDTPPNTTTVEMTGGDADEIVMYDASILNVSDGYVGWVHGRDESTIEITGGEISRLWTYDSSTFNIRGGRFGLPGNAHPTVLLADGSGVFNLFGYGFEYEPSGGILEGLLTGYWEGGDPFALEVYNYVYLDHTVLHVIPEPATLSLLALGGLLLRRRRPTPASRSNYTHSV